MEIRLREGEMNTIFFHIYTSHCHAQNTIWSLKGTKCRTISSFQDLSKEAELHFSYVFKAYENKNIGDVMKVVRFSLPFSVLRIMNL